MSLLTVEGLFGGYGGVDILRGVNLRVEPKEVVSVVGPNGAGKSTLMKAIFGLVRVRKGRIVFAGEEITHLPPEKVVRKGICYVPQTQNVFPSLTVLENLEMGAFVRNDDFRRRIDEMLALFPPLAEKRHAPAGSLSGGQQQMVAIARALMLDPILLLLDEPTAGLSPLFARMILEKVQEINRAGVGIVMVEQNARQALALSHRGYVLAQGENLYEDTGENLLRNPEVAESFLGGGRGL